MILLALFSALLPSAPAVELPAECDLIINEQRDWQRVNEPGIHAICVQSGKIWSHDEIGVIELTASGTADRPRFLYWHDPTDPHNDDHPAYMPLEKQAGLSQFVISGDWWVLDRLTIRGSVGVPSTGSGRHNLLNRMIFERPLNRGQSSKANYLLFRFDSGAQNTVQHSVFRDAGKKPGVDGYAVYFHKETNSRFLYNEMINLAGGIQEGPLSGGNHVAYGNEFYITEEAYTDCNGSYTPTGNCMCSEGQALVLKGAQGPGGFRFEHNIAWGLKPSDRHCAGSGTPGSGINIGSGGRHTGNADIVNNIVIGTVPYGILLGRHVEDIRISGNYLQGAEIGIQIGYGQNIIVDDNTFQNIGTPVRIGSYATNVNVHGSRSAEPGERCFVRKHITSPQLVCLPD
jgi:hypothetical protein